ncbi:NAD(P)-binding protein, partial [Sporormia fimetaria CBS 119925]
TLPTTQKAIIYDLSNETLSLSPDSPLPPSATLEKEHLLQVHSTAITRNELLWGPFCPAWSRAHVPCYDVSGTILTSVPSSPFKPGDRVFGRVDAQREGCARQYATILPSEAALVPEGLDMTEAAGVPMSAHTAWQGLFEKGLLTGSFSPDSVPRIDDDGVIQGQHLARGKRILILGAAGGVGLLAVQFAKLAGAWVAGTASSRNESFLRELGIDEVIEYTKSSIEEWIADAEDRKFDLVFDCVGGASALEGWHGVKSNGVYISIVPDMTKHGGMEVPAWKPEGVRAEWFIMEARGKELEGIGRFFQRGLVRGQVDSVWAMEEYKQAFDKTGGGHARGKVVIKVGSG